MLSQEVELETPGNLAAVASPEAFKNPVKRPNLPGYVSPSIEIVYYPERANLFDGFVISGRAWGSELQGAFAYVTISGVTRRAPITDGLWTVIFEDDALPKHYSGQKEIVAQLRDNLGHIVRTAVSLYIEDFVDSFITVDDDCKIVTEGRHQVLHAKGELNLGTHQEGRELVVLLVRDDVPEQVVAAGEVASGWHHGEWSARIRLSHLKAGSYRVKAQLMDCANTALTRVITSPHAILVP